MRGGVVLGSLALALALAACSTPPPDVYHTLRGPPGAASGGTRAADRVLAIGPVTVPQALERAGWVVREGDTAVRVYEHQLWTQDVADEIAQALADDLDAGPAAASRPWADPAPPAALRHPTIAPPGALRVRVQVLRFESRLEPAPGVSDALRWTLECGTTQDAGWLALRSAVREASVPAARESSGGEDPGARFDRLAAAHAQVLALVAGDIEHAFDETAAVRAQRCAGAAPP
jgi:uncharacterized lipoprotein YmbA